MYDNVNKEKDTGYSLIEIECNTANSIICRELKLEKEKLVKEKTEILTLNYMNYLIKERNK